jgi:hypothetical protein
VDVKGDESFVYERRQTGVCIRLVLEPLASASGGRGTEINQQRFVLIFSLRQRLIGICDPFDWHLNHLP